MRGLVAFVAFAGVVLASSDTRAQGLPTPNGFLPVIPHVVRDPISPLGDASGDAGSLDAPKFVLNPLRLALYSDAPAVGRSELGCGEVSTAMRLVPKLTLVGFSRKDCGSDSAIGGGLVFTQRLAPSTWLAFSAGILHLPHYLGAPGPTNISHARADVVVDRGGGKSYSVGIGTRGVTFGGVF